MGLDLRWPRPAPPATLHLGSVSEARWWPVIGHPSPLMSLGCRWPSGGLWCGRIQDWNVRPAGLLNTQRGRLAQGQAVGHALPLIRTSSGRAQCHVSRLRPPLPTKRDPACTSEALTILIGAFWRHMISSAGGEVFKGCHSGGPGDRQPGGSWASQCWYEKERGVTVSWGGQLAGGRSHLSVCKSPAAEINDPQEGRQGPQRGAICHSYSKEQASPSPPELSIAPSHPPR